MICKFKEFDVEDVEMVLPYFTMRENDTCDSTVFDSFLWRKFYQVEYCIQDNKCVQWLMKLDDEAFAAVPLCKAEDLNYYFNELKNFFNQKLNIKLRIYSADTESLRILNLSSDEYDIIEEDDQKDYLYDAESLKKLAGKKYHKKKNHINAFLREYEGRYEYRRLGYDNKKDIWRFLDEWNAKKQDDIEDHLLAEAEGIHEILDFCVHMGIKGGGIYIDGKLQAFSFGTYNPLLKMAVIHIEKANPDIRGLYPFINQQFLINEFPQAELVNREDDMGLEGLRKAKESYHPIGYARKYSIIQK